jgi:hypothetical protein
VSPVVVNSSSLSVSESASVPGNSSDSSATSSSGDEDTNQSVNSEDNFHTDNTDYAIHEYSSEYHQAVENYSVHERIIHFLSPYHTIDSTSRAAVEMALLIHPGTQGTDRPQTDGETRDDRILQNYVAAVESLPFDKFHPDSLQAAMKIRLHGSNDINSPLLWDRFKDIHSYPRTNYLISENIPSGKQLREVYNQHSIKVYCKENISLLLVY